MSTQFVQHYNDFAFAVQMGKSPAVMAEEFHLTSDQVITALAFYTADNTVELEKLLASAVPVSTEPAPEAPAIVLDAPEDRPEFGYKATPRHSFLFVKPVPKEHKGRLIIPKAFESTSDMGFVHAAGPDVVDVKVGNLVLFDKYAEVGNRFTLLDEEGELVDMIQMREDNVTAIMERVCLT